MSKDIELAAAIAELEYWRRKCLSRGPLWYTPEKTYCDYCGAFELVKKLPDEPPYTNRVECPSRVSHKPHCKWVLAKHEQGS